MVEIFRAQLSRKQKGVDITVKLSKGIARQFAPTWDMVMGHKNGIISDEEYTTQYYAILDKLPKTTWLWLYNQAEHDCLTVLCFCKYGKFCHTLLLGKYAAEHYSEMFINRTDIRIE